MTDTDAVPFPPRRVFALVAAVLTLAAATTLANRVLPGWAYPLCGLAAALILIGLGRAAGCTWTDLGLSTLRRPALIGLAGAALIAVVFGIALAVPSLRTVYQDGRVGDPDLGQLLWLTCGRILFGTVLIEEVAFRGVLPGLFGATDDRWRWPPILCSAALFGLWHALPALAIGRNAAVHAVFGSTPVVVLQVLAMAAAGVAGVFLHWWRHAGRGVLASVIVHFTTNAGGLTLAVLVR
ncbi:membrane protease YdiL (CAAX protease family) [Amycolatopsis lexingtonensis]|uniref:Membrane protease YdiL (CAAX protease family) n=2 Tax=Amycolatopsis lexingtonensis TaxID=218822 RepID=A0ABR9IFW6_9PSEU|nr:CPBP family intramembrane glutamic endopeptidase [Amycolatopsis lexingtonensis]MBE1502066.1 membrane protease YdiL (CAAX protease family) [Amycolatopsis lexingtonensis]